eukprot:UN16927
MTGNLKFRQISIGTCLSRIGKPFTIDT